LRSSAFFMVLAVLFTVASAYGVADDGADTSCANLYFLNAVFIYSTNLSGNILYIETPVNFTDFGVRQEVRLVISRGVFRDSSGYYYVEVGPEGPTYAYVLMKVSICSRSFDYAMSTVKKVLADPSSALREASGAVGSVPEDLIGRFPENVATSVRADFEAWLKGFSWYQNESVASHPLVVSVFGAAFIYLGNYIRYSANLTPRSLDEVISRREGDCDDMSRLLLVLLWSYRIPSLMLLGFVSLPDFSVRSSLGGLEYVFLGGGPHAFVMAYAQGYGWLSLDLLAGSLLTHPFVVWGTSRDVEISPESVEGFVELHRSISGKQLIASLSVGDPVTGSAKALEEFINTTLSIAGPAGQSQNQGKQPPVTTSAGMEEPLHEPRSALSVLLLAAAAVASLLGIVALISASRSLKEIQQTPSSLSDRPAVP
jgi:hypothetical protein